MGFVDLGALDWADVGQNIKADDSVSLPIILIIISILISSAFICFKRHISVVNLVIQ